MSTKRWAAQIGLLSATVVFVASIGVLIFQGGGNASAGAQPQSSGGSATHTQNLPISLSAASANDSSAAHH